MIYVRHTLNSDTLSVWITRIEIIQKPQDKNAIVRQNDVVLFWIQRLLPSTHWLHILMCGLSKFQNIESHLSSEIGHL